MYIACPKCDWHPQETDLWECTCQYVWHVFDTGGICPACGDQWHDTICPICGEWSSHEDWYHYLHDLTVSEYLQSPWLVKQWPIM